MKFTQKTQDITVIAVLIASFIAMTSFLFDSPWILFFLSLPIPLILIYRYENIHHAFRMSLVSAILGPVTEIICVKAGLWEYANTGGLPFIPPWLFTGWASFSLSLILLAQIILGKKSLKVSPNIFLMSSGLVLQVVLFYIFGKSSSDGLIVAVLIIITQLLIFKSKETIVLIAIGVFIGPLVEIFPISFGAWQYSLKEFCQMPYYMPLAYGTFAVFVCNLSLSATRYKVAEKRR